MHPSQTYPSDLTDDQWHILQPLIPKPKLGGRPIIHSRRMILNAIYYVNRSGCQWSMLPKDFPPKSTVFDYFSAWRKSGLWEKLNESLRVKVRVAEGRKPSPTAAISSTARASKAPSRVATPSATMRARRSAGASDTSSSTPSG